MRLLRTALLAICTLSLLSSPQAFAADSSICFSETNHCISGAIRTYWESNGSLHVFSYSITDLFTDQVEDSWTGPVQWFERDRLEDHTNEQLGVMAGRLGAIMLEIQDRPWEQLPQVTSAPDGCRYFPAA